MQLNMLSGSPIKNILKFGFPILIGNLFQQLYIAVDTIIIDSALNSNAVLGIGNAGMIYTAVLWFVQGMAAGFAVVNSQAFGSGDAKKVKQSLAITFALSLIITVILTSVMLLSLEASLKLINVSPYAYEYAKDYLIVMFIGIGSTVFFNVALYSMRALGDAKTPFIYLVGANILNILLDYLFVIVLEKGAYGAAAATVISQFAALIGCFVSMHLRFPQFRIKKVDFFSSKSYYFKHFSFGTTSAMQVTIIAFTLIAQQMAVNSQNNDIMIGYVVGYKIDQFAQQIIVAFALALATFVGQNYGAGNFERIRLGVKQGSVLIISITLMMSAILILGGKLFTALYLPDAGQEIINASYKYILYQAAFYILLALLQIFRNTSQNLGQYTMCFFACIMEFVSRLIGVIAFGNVYDAVPISNIIGWAGSCALLIPTYIMTMRKLTGKIHFNKKTHKLAPAHQ